MRASSIVLAALSFLLGLVVPIIAALAFLIVLAVKNQPLPLLPPPGGNMTILATPAQEDAEAVNGQALVAGFALGSLALWQSIQVLKRELRYQQNSCCCTKHDCQEFRSNVNEVSPLLRRATCDRSIGGRHPA